MRYGNSRAKRRNDWRRLDADVAELQSLGCPYVDDVLSLIGTVPESDRDYLKFCEVVDFAASVAALDTPEWGDRDGHAEAIRDSAMAMHSYFVRLSS